LRKSSTIRALSTAELVLVVCSVMVASLVFCARRFARPFVRAALARAMAG
jgi:hypothetical protein